MKLRYLLFIILILSMTGCATTYVLKPKSDDIKQDRPDENSVNYSLYYSINAVSYNKKGEEASYLDQKDQKEDADQNVILTSNTKVKSIMRKEVDKIFNRNKLLLNENFGKNSNYYLDINLRTRKTIHHSFSKALFLTFFSVVTPYPFLWGEWNFFLNIDVYDSKPLGAAKPVAMYEYKRTVRERYSFFIYILGVLPVMYWGNWAIRSGDSYTASQEYGLADAMDDMLLEFTCDLKSGKHSNITRKSDIFTEIE